MIIKLTEQEITSLKNGHCPDCNETSWSKGPQVGHASVIKCDKEKCGSRFCVVGIACSNGTIYMDGLVRAHRLGDER